MTSKIISVASEAELSEVVAGAEGPLAVRGGGTRGVHVPGQVLSVAGMTGITLYDPGALTMVAQAGTPLAEIEAALAANNQRLAFEPMDHRGLLGTPGTPTIGGVFAANISGPRRIAVGAARDFLLGVRFVDGQGHIIKNGGRVMKNVTGYDLVKLLAGSFGTLGVISEVSFKVLPQPETQSALVLQGLSDGAAVDMLSRAMGSPYEVTGAAHGPAKAQTLLRIEGFEASVRYRIEQLQSLLGADQMDVLDAGQSHERWLGLRDVEAFNGQPGDVWKISCKPTQGPELAAKSRAEAHFFDWAGGLIWLRMPAGSDLRARLGAFDGHATLVRADAATQEQYGMFQPEPAGVARLSAGLRAKFDPRGIFNTGLMGAAQ